MLNVLFISKPIAPPFHDGSKCLVRDIATRLERVEPIVLSTRDAPALLRGADANRPVRTAAIYSNSGSHAPSLSENLRAASWLLTRSQADLWHFVFAPNPRSSQVARWLARARRTPVVQTIASPPRDFERVSRLLFGDVVVAQSEWTAERVRGACQREGLAPPDLRVIPPPVPEQLARTREQSLAARAVLDIAPDAPLFIYPGDVEVSSGGRASLGIAARLAEALPEAVTLFAYRRKTSGADAAADALRRDAPKNARFAASIPDVLALVASASAVIFPVDDLWGKVDLPIVLLEAMVLGVPVLVLREGPLAELTGAELIDSLEPEAWLASLLTLGRDAAARAHRIEQQRRISVARSSANAVARAYEDIYVELGARGVRAAGRAG
ncbi:MAG: glycosyltransferase family 4 protein [Polyangiaceae bacterium]